MVSNGMKSRVSLGCLISFFFLKSFYRDVLLRYGLGKQRAVAYVCEFINVSDFHVRTKTHQNVY